MLIQGVVYLVCASFVSAMPSEQCLNELGKALKTPAARGCHEPMCGSLDKDNNLEGFLHRMSSNCKDKLLEYRKPEPLTSLLSDPESTSWLKGMLRSQLEDRDSAVERKSTPTWQRCSTSFEARFASNPVVVENHVSANFVMCTIPKAGCTLLRSLLYVLTHPESQTQDFTHAHVHNVAYPTTWHYRDSKHEADNYPTVRSHTCPHMPLRTLCILLTLQLVLDSEP